MTTSIEWTRNADGSDGETWNPIRARRRSTGKAGWYCQKVSPGCKNCYAEAMNQFRGNGLPYTVPSFYQAELYLDEKALLQPTRWRKPRTVFVCSMTDLYADFVPDEWLDKIHAIEALTPEHTYIHLTKRPERRKRYFEELDAQGDEHRWWNALVSEIPDLSEEAMEALSDCPDVLPNVWQGTSVCTQDEANRLILPTLQTRAALHLLSCEPLLEPLDLCKILCSEDDGPEHYEYEMDALAGRFLMLNTESLDALSDDPENPRIGWVIVGGESGRGAWPTNLDAVRNIVAQCKAANVPVFVKQLGRHPFQPREADGVFVPDYEYYLEDAKGGDPAEWPEDLRVREVPAVRA